MLTCPQCGKENPDGFQFCGFCTAPLIETPPAREQRKVVTVLFCDLTGSTELGEVLARQSETQEAIRLAEEAIQLTEVTDYLNLRADCNLSLSEVLRQFGRVGVAISAAEKAHRPYDQKGNIVSAARVRTLIEDWRQSAPPLG